MSSSSSTHAEIDQWFSEYFKTFIDIGAGRSDSEKILLYWGVPLHSSSPKHSTWLNSAEKVVGVLNEMQGILKQIGYTHTEALEKAVTVYNKNAGRVDTIMSRRKGDDTEVDRAAVSFELRRTNIGWIIISTTSCPTQATKLREVW